MENLIFSILGITAILLLAIPPKIQEHRAYKKEKLAGEKFKEYKKRMKNRRY